MTTLPLRLSGAGEHRVVDMQWKRRVLLISADAGSAQLQAQLAILAQWPGADDRDISVVQIVGETVVGSDDEATSLRRRYKIRSGHFMTLLLGKDGHIALRSSDPVTAKRLEQTIDAMPMRQAGER